MTTCPTLDESFDEEANLLKLSMQSLKEHYGLKPGKHSNPAREIGHQLGRDLANRLSATNLDAVIDELAAYWSQNGIGEMSWEDRAHLLLKIRDCSDCLGQAYGAGYTLCPFKEGLLEAVLQAKTSSHFKVREIECCGTQAPNCLFQINQA
jgi:uncharacterized protein